MKKQNIDSRHYVYQDIGMVKGYRLENETLESDVLIINHIRIEINLSSNVGAEFYETIKDKFRPECLKPKYATSAFLPSLSIVVTYPFSSFTKVLSSQLLFTE